MIETTRKFFVLVLIVLAILAILTGGKFLYLFLYFALFLFIIPYSWLRISLNRLKGRVEVPSSRAEVGQYITVKYVIKNHSSGRFPYLELSSFLDLASSAKTESKIVCIEAGEQVSYSFDIYCRRRGKYDLKSFRVKTGDPFGNFQLSKTLAADQEITVYPRLRSLPTLNPLAHQNFGKLAVSNRQFENYSQVSDLRNWHAGDSKKKIHWKQSARQERLLVKNYDQKGDATLNIFIDMAANGYDYDKNNLLEDLAVETAASLLFHNLKVSTAVEVFSQSFSRHSLVGTQLRDFWTIMDQVVTLKKAAAKPFHNFVVDCSYYLAPNSSLYLITPQLDPLAAATFLKLRLKGFNLVLLNLCDEDLVQERIRLIESLREAGIRVLLLSSDPGDYYGRAKI
jgi:uncharacterized protein (DUF58 family)